MDLASSLKHAGNIILNRKYPAGRANLIQPLETGEYLLAGLNQIDPVVTFLMKTDSSGNVTFFRGYPFSQANYVIHASGGGYIMTGGFAHVFLFKTNELGDTLWTRHYCGNSSGSSSSMSGVSEISGKCVQETFDWGFIICSLRWDQTFSLKNSDYAKIIPIPSTQIPLYAIL